MAKGRIASQMIDAFGDYFLKSRKAVEESELGQTEAKPAGAYIKEMRRQGVPEEEMADLGLLRDFDPKGKNANRRLTRDEFLAAIDARRDRLLRSEGIARADDTPDELPELSGGRLRAGADTKYRSFTVDLGQSDPNLPDDYEEIVYTSGFGNTREPSASLLREEGLHFPERNQLFHLRLNRAKTEDGEGVTNLLEIQSDIQQRAQSGKRNPNDPVLPMRNNWEKLGVKEAIKLAVARGDRYLAIPPSDETAESVGARTRVRKGNYVVDIERAKEDGELALQPTGHDLSGSYESFMDIAGDSPSSAFVKPELLEDQDLLEEIGFFEDMGDYRLSRVGTYAHSYVTDSLVELGLEIDADTAASARQFNEEGRELFDKFYETLDPDEQMQIGSYDEFMRDFVLVDDASQILDDAETGILEQGARTATFGTDPIPKDRLLKLLDINEAELARRLEAGDTEGLKVTLDEDIGVGGEGLRQFYDQTIQSEKRIKELGVPLVDIVQTRPDGSLVQTKAFDLKSLQGKKPKDIPYSLYNLASSIIFAGGALAATTGQEEPTTFNEGGTVMKEGVDPVSGNEKPVGSLPEEVRDDVPAMLSEGEFVLPADVVRYIGLDRIMQMRDQAKEGLARMEAMGQMGNSDEATLPSDTPHESLDFNVGGAVPSVYDPSQFTTANSLTNNTETTTANVVASPTAPAFEMKVYVNDAGNTIYVPFVNGVAQMQIPEGYTEARRTVAGVETPGAETPSVSSGVASGMSQLRLDDSGSNDGDSDRDRGNTGTGSVGTGAVTVDSGDFISNLTGKPTMWNEQLYGSFDDWKKANPDSELAKASNEARKNTIKNVITGGIAALTGMVSLPLAAAGVAGRSAFDTIFGDDRSVDDISRDTVRGLRQDRIDREVRRQTYQTPQTREAERRDLGLSTGDSTFDSGVRARNYTPEVNARGNIRDDFDQRAQDAAFERAREQARQNREAAQRAEAARQAEAQRAAAAQQREYERASGTGGSSSRDSDSDSDRSSRSSSTSSMPGSRGGNTSRGFVSGGWNKGGLIKRPDKY